MLTALQSLVDPDHGAEISSFLRDAARFIARSDTIIDECPLQIYASGLVFAPSRSIVRTAFRDCIPGWITRLPQTPQSWDASLRVIETSLGRKGAICFLPDNRSLQTVSDNGAVQVWDTTTGRQIDSFEANGGHQMIFSSDGKCSLSTNRNGAILFWGSLTGSLQYKPKLQMKSLALSSDGSLAAYATRNGPTYVLDYQEGKLRERSYGKNVETTRIALSPDGRQLAVIQGPTSQQLWEANSGRETTEGPLTSTMQLWDVDSGEKTTERTLDVVEVYQVCFSPDSKLIASTQRFDVVVQYARTGEVFQTLKGHTEQVKAIAFAPDGQHIISTSVRGRVRLWHLATGEEVTRFQHPYDTIDKVVFSPDGCLLAASSEGMILLWDSTVKHEAYYSIGNVRPIQYLAVSRDTKLAASVSALNRAETWDLNTAQNIQTIARSPKGIFLGIFFSEMQEDLVWSIYRSNTIKCHDPISGKEIYADHLNNKQSELAISVAFSPDGSSVALLYSGKVKIWGLSTRKLQHTLVSKAIISKRSFFSSDSKTFVSATSYGKLIILDLTSGRTKQAEAGQIFDSAATPSLHGSVLAVPSAKLPEVKFWDVDTGACLGIARVNEPLHYVEFDAAGSRLITEQGYIEVPPLDRYDPHEPAPHRHFEGYGLARNLPWITWRGRPFIWLPPSYRPPLPSPNRKTSLFMGSTVILGMSSGYMSIIEFVETPPWET